MCILNVGDIKLLLSWKFAKITDLFLIIVYIAESDFNHIAEAKSLLFNDLFITHQAKKIFTVFYIIKK